MAAAEERQGAGLPGGGAPLLPISFDPFMPRRRVTRVVRVGDVPVGGDQPIRIQSMTNTNTLDTQATVEQTVRLAQAGCEIVRITAPSIRDAENLRAIKQALRARGITVPLVADIHFTPNAAMIAAEIVEKVRINPGNYADKKRFEVRHYADAEYADELERVAARFRPLVLRCKQNGVAMRIGTNHGSLSDRIMNRFGDTPEGMVESALEFLDVCEAEGFRDVVFSMKSSNTQVAIAAYRLLAARLEARAPGEPSYPFHVGVTEAGDAEDGRIKSAIGIGALLEDGIGDTIRVSLTEDPVREVPVARTIAQIAGARARAAGPALASDVPLEPFSFARRETRSDMLGREGAALTVGGEAPVRVELDLVGGLAAPADTAARLAVELAGLRDIALESLLVTLEGRDAPAAGTAVEGLEALARELASLGLTLPLSLRIAHPSDALVGLLSGLPDRNDAPALARVLARLVARVDASTSERAIRAVLAAAEQSGLALEWELDGDEGSLHSLARRLLELEPERVVGRAVDAPGGAWFSRAAGDSVHAVRRLSAALAESGAAARPIVLRQRVMQSGAIPQRGGVAESALVEAAVRLGSSLCDGIGDMVSLAIDVASPLAPSAAATIDLAYRILQGARLRTTRTEYISCPSCGRTLFDLEETTARIKARTDHLSGVKIAVMGCIVNGPGEMADADFGYVGSGVGQVTLYVGKEIVERAVPEAEAPDRLVDLIRRSGRWVDVA